MKIRLAAPLQKNSIVDGSGIRAVIWTQGCTHKCPGCHNPETHSFSGGFVVDTEDLKKELDLLAEESGVTFSGGDPFNQVEACLDLAKHCHSLGLNVWCYTGFTYERLISMAEENESILNFLKEIDCLVDGPFILKEKSFDVKFRGSKNQRIIDVKKSLSKKKIVEVKEYQYKEKKLDESQNKQIYI